MVLSLSRVKGYIHTQSAVCKPANIVDERNRTELAQGLGIAIGRLRSANQQLESAGTEMKSGPALTRLLQVIAIAEAVLDRGPEHLLPVTLQALQRALDGATREICTAHGLSFPQA